MITLSTRKHWLVTGGAGFIGSHLVRELLRQHQQVTVLDNLSNSNLQTLADIADQISFIRADICDPTGALHACQHVDVVLHHAAQVSVPASVQNPHHTFKNNLEGTKNLLRAAQHSGVKRFIFASSCAVYGDSAQLPYTEHSPLHCQSPYAQTKALAEQSCLTCKNLETVILRYFNVYGTGQNPHAAYAAVIAKFMQQARENKPLDLEWDGKQSRDFIAVQDVVQANLLAATKGVAGEIYNVAGGKSYTILQVVNTLEKIAGHKLERNMLPKRPGDVHASAADISKIKKLGFSPSITLEEGLRTMWKNREE